MVLNNSLVTFKICLGIILTTTFVACQSNRPLAVTTPTPHVVVSEQTSQPTIQMKPTTTVVSELPTNTVIPSVTDTPAPTLIPTMPFITPATDASPLHKVAELAPIGGSNLAISDDGMLVAVSNHDTGFLYVFDRANQEIRWEIYEDERAMTAYTTLAFSPDKRLLAGGGVDQDVFVWDMNNGNLIYKIPVPYSLVNRVSFSADNNQLAISTPETYSADAGILIWDFEAEQFIDSFPSSNPINFSTELEGPHLLETFDESWSVGDAIYIPNQTNLVAITVRVSPFNEGNQGQGGLYFWDIDNQQLREVLPGSTGYVITTSPDGHLLVTDIDGKIYGWDIKNDIEVFSHSIEDGSTYQLTLTNAGLWARVSWDGIVTIWNFSGELLATLELNNEVRGLAFTPDGELIITYWQGDNPVTEIWELNNSG